MPIHEQEDGGMLVSFSFLKDGVHPSPVPSFSLHGGCSNCNSIDSGQRSVICSGRSTGRSGRQGEQRMGMSQEHGRSGSFHSSLIKRSSSRQGGYNRKSFQKWTSGGMAATILHIAAIAILCTPYTLLAQHCLHIVPISKLCVYVLLAIAMLSVTRPG